MQKGIAFRVALATAGIVFMSAGTAFAQAPVGKAATSIISDAQARAAMKSATPAEKRLSVLPSSDGPATNAALGVPQTVPGGAGGKVVPAVNVESSSDSAIDPKNYGCSTATCTGTNLNTIFHFNDSRIDPTVITHDPYRRTGYFLHTFNGSSFFFCTATLISRSILVTAGHCVYDTNINKFITSGTFIPACTNCNGGGTPVKPYGQATANFMVTTAGWANAANESVALDKGFDVGLVVLNKRTTPTVAELGNIVGWQGFCIANCLQPFWQLSQLGYPANYDGGNRMQYGEHIEQSDTKDYKLGSGMQGGSSGGPHTSNIGVLADSTADKGRFVNRNVIFAVTSWGFIDDSFKIQGASSLSGPGNTNSVGGFKTLFNVACNRARLVHGVTSCTPLP